MPGFEKPTFKYESKKADAEIVTINFQKRENLVK
jgi:hypothetical protein